MHKLSFQLKVQNVAGKMRSTIQCRFCDIVIEKKIFHNCTNATGKLYIFKSIMRTRQPAIKRASEAPATHP